MTGSSLQRAGLAIVAGAPIVAALSVVLRIVARRRLRFTLGCDDYTIVTAAVLALVSIVPNWQLVKMWNLGIDLSSVPVEDRLPSYQKYYPAGVFFQLSNYFIMALAKASIIFLLLRVGSVMNSIRYLLYGALCLTITCAVVPMCLFLAYCPPPEREEPPVQFGDLHCKGHFRTAELLLSVTCTNLLTDFIILPIPFIIVRRMRTAATRQRVTILLLFLCSSVVTIIGITKLSFAVTFRLKEEGATNPRRDLKFCINTIENNMAILVANIPIIRSLWTMLTTPNASIGPNPALQTPVFLGEEEQQGQVGSKREGNLDNDDDDEEAILYDLKPHLLKISTDKTLPVEQPPPTPQPRANLLRKLFPSVMDGGLKFASTNTTKVATETATINGQNKIVVVKQVKVEEQKYLAQSHNASITKDLVSFTLGAEDDDHDGLEKESEKKEEGWEGRTVYRH